ncbi:SigE-dependent sporulation protein [Halobacillus litoralis]|uniref:SigE-dependent sporulation protein n=2 Tax=Halobacillus TaxID=45667 RepID=A0A845FDW6_9BACI|nr:MULTISPECIES: sporulation YhaL family protein [Halobacillus]MBN9655859.1 sporulation YhaL family protein [Halobacillus sp. GSS1]MBX0357204.1 sporulation YhaL family protein [Halobacillus sp. Nhm2S1]MEC3883763.1 sporulation YhaL family protein [Halobacillus sp. HZG1]MYL72041.1 SigE-dependent sporulation protein [Halobacillus litoralis]GEN52993.1 sporulation protein YhaL [Halobacillus faecis]
MLFGLPIWVFLCIVFIFISGYMAIRAMRAEHNLEQEYIEREGQVYLKRIEKEKERRGKRDAMMSE